MKSGITFEKLVRIRWTISILFAVLMLTAYIGFIMVVAFKREWLSIKFSGNIPLSIPVGVGIILFSWILTGLYIAWANSRYDKIVKSIVDDK
jgi:uncharacterized membrane protein (DUF485 family)